MISPAPSLGPECLTNQTPCMSTVNAARYCGFRTSRGLLSAYRRGKVVPVGRRGKTGAFTWRREDLIPPRGRTDGYAAGGT